MIKRTAVIWSATGMLLTLLSAPVAHSSSAISKASAQSLLTLSGVHEQLDALPEAVRTSFNQLFINDGVAEPFETADIPKLKHAVASVFNAHALQTSITDSLRATMSADDASEMTRFYSTPTGIALRAAERNNSVLTNSDRFVHWYQTVGMERLDEERQQAIQSLELAMQATAGAVEAMIGMQLSMQVSLTPVLPASEQLSPEQLMVVVEQMRRGLTQTYYESSLQTLAFVFKDQPLETLHVYAKQLNSTAGQRFVSAVNDGLSRGLFGAAEQLGVSLQEILAGRLGQGV